MPGKYKVNIEKESEGYRFYVFPPNNYQQPVARSVKIYPDYRSCKAALEDFKSLVLKYHIDKIDDHRVRLITEEINGLKRYSFVYYLENGEPVCEYPRKYDHKQSCNTGIRSVLTAMERDG